MSPRILIADQLDPTGLEMLRRDGAEVRQLKKEERERLPEILADFDALVVRSATKVTADLLRAGKRLKVVGRAGIGVDNVDVAAATELGILVVNAPTANAPANACTERKRQGNWVNDNKGRCSHNGRDNGNSITVPMSNVSKMNRRRSRVMGTRMNADLRHETRMSADFMRMVRDADECGSCGRDVD